MIARSFLPALIPGAMASLLLAGGVWGAELIAGVDFEGESPSIYDSSPDDLNPADGISVSSGTAAPVFNGWTLLLLDGSNGAAGNLRNDAGANAAGATTPDFPARLETARTGSWSITIPADVVLDLDRMEFDVRAATNASGRDGQFNTSLDGNVLLWEDLNLNGRTSGNWQHISVDLSGPLYQDLTGQTVSFNWRTTTSGAIDLDTILLYGTIDTGSHPFAITAIEYAAEAGTVTLTWRKTSASSYIAKYSLDMTDWETDLRDGLTEEVDENPGDPDHLTVTFSLNDLNLQAGQDVFFRIEEE
jgi:hypothetical protein